MELDDDKLSAAKADGRLEKPFDVQDLRRLINQFVPQTQSQRLSSYLSFPKMPEMLDAKKPSVSVDPSGGVSPEPEETWDMESFEEVPLPTPPKADVISLPVDDDDDDDEVTTWSTKPLGKFRVDAAARKDEPAVKLKDVPESREEADLELESALPPMPPEPQTAKASPSLSEEELLKIIQSQSREVIEAVVWKVVPDLAAQIIEREIKRLLAEKNHES